MPDDQQHTGSLGEKLQHAARPPTRLAAARQRQPEQRPGELALVAHSAVTMPGVALLRELRQ